MEGKVINWDSTLRRLEVATPKGLIYIPEDEITTYSLEKIAPSGIPNEILDLYNQTISFVPLSKGCWSRKAVMEKDYNAIHNGDIIQGRVIAFSESGNTFFHYKSLTLISSMKDLSTSFVTNPREYLQIAQTVSLKILQKSLYSYTKVSYSAAYPDNVANYNQGCVLTCKVSMVRKDLNAYFLEVSPSVRGIMDSRHCPDLSYGKMVICHVRKVTPKGLKLKYIDVL